MEISGGLLDSLMSPLYLLTAEGLRLRAAPQALVITEQIRERMFPGLLLLSIMTLCMFIAHSGRMVQGGVITA